MPISQTTGPEQQVCYDTWLKDKIAASLANNKSTMAHEAVMANA